ncbi:MAG: calcium-binding protein [Actinomycetota bacterium]
MTNATADTTIDVEVVSGPNNADGNSPGAPDFLCSILSGQSACSVNYTGTQAGTDVLRGWVAHAGVDLNEGENETSAPGSSAEPDTTDVISVVWQVGSGGPVTTLDCDDAGGTDTERETNIPSGTGSSEVYTCTVRNAQGGIVTAVNTQVKGENETNVNDPPDGTDNGATYGTPDYTCQTGTTGSCQITVAPTDGETGTTTICFYTGDGSACGSENIDEAEANDLADRVELRWTLDIPVTQVDASPETQTSTLTTNADSHRITVVARGANNVRAVDATNIKFAISAGPNAGTNATNVADGTCVQDETFDNNVADETHRCNYTNTTDTAGTDQIRVFADLNNDNDHDQGEPFDDVTRTWVTTGPRLTLTPATDGASVGTCNPFTVRLVDQSGQPLRDRIIDVEQRHARALNNTANDEPTVAFCTPTTGPNATGMNTGEGDLSENPDNLGTLGGETIQDTDSNGQLTLGIQVTPGNGSNGTGDVTVSAFWDTTGGDDPDPAEAQDTSVKTWVVPEGRTIDCEPETGAHDAGLQHTVACTVMDRFGALLPGVGVTFTSSGPGTFVSTQQLTEANGTATAVVTSTTVGTQTITGTLTSDVTGNEPSEVDGCDRSAGDPAGAPAGVCQDSVTHTWTQPPVATLVAGPEEVTDRRGDSHLVSVLALDRKGDPVPGATIVWTSAGQGTISNPETVTNASGIATATVTSATVGVQVVTATATPCDTGGVCTDTSINNWGPKRCTVFGTVSADLLTGTGGNDVICGFGGADIINGNGGDDLLLGSSGKDFVRGGQGIDQIRGGPNADEIYGDQDDDRLRGGRGHDFLDGGAGIDVCTGGPGNDNLLRCN